MQAASSPAINAANSSEDAAVLENYLNALPLLAYQWKVVNGGEIRARNVKPPLSPLGAYCKAQAGVELEPHQWRRAARLTGMPERVAAMIYLAEDLADGFSSTLRHKILKVVRRIAELRPSEQWRKKPSGPRVGAAAS